MKFRSNDYEYADLPEDTALLCEIVDIEDTVQNPRFLAEGEEPRPQLLITFEVVEGEYQGEKIRAWLNATFGSKSSLRKLTAAAFDIDPERVEELDTDELMGRRVYVIGDFGEDGKSSFLRPRKYKPASEQGKSARRPGGRRRAASAESGERTDRQEQPVAHGRKGKTEMAAVGADGRVDGADEDSDIDF